VVRAVRLLTKKDGMGFSMSDVRVGAGAEQYLWYKHHWEANYIISGRVTITHEDSGRRWELGAGDIYNVGPQDPHRGRRGAPGVAPERDELVGGDRLFRQAGGRPGVELGGGEVDQVRSRVGVAVGKAGDGAVERGARARRRPRPWPSCTRRRASRHCAGHPGPLPPRAP